MQKFKEQKYKDGSTRDQHRKQLHSVISKLLKPSKSKGKKKSKSKGKKKFIGDILAGDLQETITVTARDNKGRHFYNRLKFGVMDAIEQSPKSMCSVVFEYESDMQNPYITRNEFTKFK